MGGRIEVNLLGSVEVCEAGTPVNVSGAKLRAIVALLALGAPHPVSDERLIDEVWDDELPTNPANALQAQISALRRLLGREAVERRGAGYVIALGPDDVDTIRLERLVRAGRLASSERDHAAAAVHFDAAVALVRGRSLDDISEFRFAREAAIRLNELVFEAHEGAVDAQLALGSHQEVVARLTGLVSDNPLRERFRAQLITALYRCGRQADALRVYSDGREILLEELGVDPGPELQALEQAILTQASSLDAPPEASPRAVEERSADTEGFATPDRFPLVGRAADLRALRVDLQGAEQGRGRVVLLGGEPGIGKTRLVEELAATVDDNTIVVWGRCYDGRGAPAFWPWTQIVNGLLARVEPDVLRHALGVGVADIAQIAPELEELVPDFDPPAPADPESARFRLYRAVSHFLRRVSETRPVLVVVDDLHWSDTASLELITLMASELDDSSVMLVGTYRDVDPLLGGALAAALVQLGRLSSVRRVALDGLQITDLEALFTAAGATAENSLLVDVHRRTQGNPFFVTELMRLAPSDGVLGDSAFGRAVPVGVRGVIRQRLDQLDAETMKTVMFAATLGQDFDLAVLAASLDVDGASLLDLLEPAIVSGIVVDNFTGGSRYRFSHGLVNETIYEEMGPAQRARTHHRIAQALDAHHGDSEGGHLPALATHWFNAVPAAPPDRGIETAIRAAQWAQGHSAHQQADEQFRAALELIATMPEDRRRWELELDVQDQRSVLLLASTSYSDPEFSAVCQRVRELCDEIDDQRLLVPAMARLTVHHFMTSDIVQGANVGAELIDRGRSENGQSAELAGHIGLGLVHHSLGDQPLARVHFGAAIEMCELGYGAALSNSVFEDPAVFVRCFSPINQWLLDDADMAEQQVSEAIEIAGRTGMQTQAATAVAMWAASTVSTLRAASELTVDRVDQGIAVAVAGGFGLVVPYMMAYRGLAFARLGDPDKGAVDISEGARTARDFGAVYMQPLFSAWLAEVHILRDQVDEALRSIEGGLAQGESTGERWSDAELYRWRAEARRRLGHADADVRSDLERSIAIATEQGAVAWRRRAELDLANLA